METQSDTIRFYYQQGYTVDTILHLLRLHQNVTFLKSTLKRRLCALGLSRNKPSPVSDVRQAIRMHGTTRSGTFSGLPQYVAHIENKV